MRKLQKINLHEKFSKFGEYWSPKFICELLGVSLKVVKFEVEFDRHHHESEDELYWVIEGQVIIHFRDGDIVLNSGELLIVSSMIEHKPEAEHEAHIVLTEPKDTVDTDNIEIDKTVGKLE